MLHMLKRLSLILLAGAELNIPKLSNCQWTLIENIIPILDVFDSVTNHISLDHVTAAEVVSDTGFVSQVIPCIYVIETELQTPAPASFDL
ncbi:hypothetical protein PR048_026697 [Dryococelus australis]|uniref:Secreted protein n=1 Tax=Dryococelus australis TaxID=614101 RepID=A0ABQ9GM28_9NEOP|nr:hypothetical protein PR048_026697 [Dryococelus australis]